MAVAGNYLVFIFKIQVLFTSRLCGLKLLWDVKKNNNKKTKKKTSKQIKKVFHVIVGTLSKTWPPRVKTQD